MIVGLGSDFCPNAFCYNMGLTAHYACTNYRLTPNEVIVAATLNAAYALNVHEKVGSIEVGKQADLLLVEAESWVYVVYSFGDCFINKVIKNGVVL
jgi:imidazolonepropionase